MMEDYRQAIEIYEKFHHSNGTFAQSPAVESIINIHKELSTQSRTIPINDKFTKMNIFQRWASSFRLPVQSTVAVLVPKGVGVKTLFNYWGMTEKHRNIFVCDNFNRADYFQTSLKYEVYSISELNSKLKEIDEIRKGLIGKFVFDEDTKWYHKKHIPQYVFIKKEVFDIELDYKFSNELYSKETLPIPKPGFIYFCNEIHPSARENYKFHQTMSDGAELVIIDAAKEILSRS